MPERRRVHVAVRRPAVPGVVAPAAAPDHPLRGPVGLLRSSSHHSQTLPCMSYKPSRFGLYEPTLQVRFKSLAVLEVRLLRQQIRRLVEVEVERAVQLVGHRPAPTGILPFRLLRQAIHPARFLLPLVQLRHRKSGIVPRHILHRKPLQVRVGDVLHRVLAAARAREVAGVAPHDLLPLLLRDLVLAQVEVGGDLHLLVARLAAAAAQPRLALRHQHELHAEAVLERRRQRLRLRHRDRLAVP